MYGTMRLLHTHYLSSTIGHHHSSLSDHHHYSHVMFLRNDEHNVRVKVGTRWNTANKKKTAKEFLPLSQSSFPSSPYSALALRSYILTHRLWGWVAVGSNGNGCGRLPTVCVLKRWRNIYGTKLLQIKINLTLITTSPFFLANINETRNWNFLKRLGWGFFSFFSPSLLFFFKSVFL